MYELHYSDGGHGGPYRVLGLLRSRTVEDAREGAARYLRRMPHPRGHVDIRTGVAGPLVERVVNPACLHCGRRFVAEDAAQTACSVACTRAYVLARS